MSEKKRGRPRAKEPGGTVCAWFPISEQDRLARIALSRRQSVSSLVRQIVSKAIKHTAEIPSTPSTIH